MTKDVGGAGAPVAPAKMTNLPAEATGFESGAMGEIDPNQVGAVSAVAREGEELRASIVVAKKFPRNEHASYGKLMKSCQRPGFAEVGVYKFPRGPQTVSGPSVNLAREAARIWGNCRYGLRIVSMDNEQVHIMGWAADLEGNTFISMEDKFDKLIQRKINGVPSWVKPDERDLRELINRRGAICVRNAILQVLPSDLIDDAERGCDETIRKAAKGEIEQSRDQATKRLVMAFQGLGVTVAMIEQKIGHGLDLLTAEELAELRQMWNSIHDGQARRDEIFEMPKPKQQQTTPVDLDDVTLSKEPPKDRPDATKKPGSGPVGEGKAK